MIVSTNPPSSPLDTLKHTVFRTIDLIEVGQDVIGGAMSNSDDIESGLEIFDAAIRTLLRSLAEHVPGVNPNGYGSPEWFESDEAREDARTYDDGSRVVLHLDDGRTVHVRYPRLEAS